MFSEIVTMKVISENVIHGKEMTIRMKEIKRLLLTRHIDEENDK